MNKNMFISTSTTTTLQFEVVNCCEEACVENDLVVIEGKPGYTLDDVRVLSYYIANPNALKVLHCAYSITVEDPCTEAIEYDLNACFLEYADFNKDGVIDIHDKDILDQLILTNSH